MEQWKSVVDMPKYEVSDLGNVREQKTGKVLLQHNSNGYRMVSFYDNGKQTPKYVHRLVAMAFLGVVSEDKEVNHKDGNRANNNLSNLEWVTPSENILHSYRELGHKRSYSPQKINTAIEKENHIRLNLKIFRVQKNLTQAEFAKRIGISRAMYALIEIGNREGSFDFWLKLQKAYDIPDEEMFKLMKYKD